MPVYCRNCPAEYPEYDGFFKESNRNLSGFDYTCLVCRRNAPTVNAKRKIPLDVMIDAADDIDPIESESILRKTERLIKKLNYNQVEMDWKQTKETDLFKINKL